MSIRVLIADDHLIIREGIKTLLEESSDVKVVGEASNGRETIRLAGELLPQIVIMDIGMPELNGVEATRQILKEHPGMRIIALSAHSDRQFVMGMLKAGASAYLTKTSAFPELKQAMNSVIRNRVYLSQDITGVVVDEAIANRAAKENETVALTVREKEILQLLAEGFPVKSIAEKLFISPKTVETHRKNIMTKLKLYTVPELTKYAIRAGLTSLDD